MARRQRRRMGACAGGCRRSARASGAYAGAARSIVRRGRTRDRRARAGSPIPRRRGFCRVRVGAESLGEPEPEQGREEDREDPARRGERGRGRFRLWQAQRARGVAPGRRREPARGPRVRRRRRHVRGHGRVLGPAHGERRDAGDHGRPRAPPRDDLEQPAPQGHARRRRPGRGAPQQRGLPGPGGAQGRHEAGHGRVQGRGVRVRERVRQADGDDDERPGGLPEEHGRRHGPAHPRRRRGRRRRHPRGREGPLRRLGQLRRGRAGQDPGRAPGAQFPRRAPATARAPQAWRPSRTRRR